MKTNTSYVLNVPVEEFFEKTLKNEFSLFLRENNLTVTPSRIEIGEFEDIAYFENNGLEYELPAIYWKYFDEVAPLPFVEESPVAPDVEDAPVATVKEAVADGPHVLTKSHMTGIFRVNNSYDDQPKQIAISPDWINLQSINELETGSVAAPTGDQLFTFYHTYVQRSGSRYYLGNKLNAGEALAKTKELYALHQRSIALDKLKRLIREEQDVVFDAIKSVTEK